MDESNLRTLPTLLWLPPLDPVGEGGWQQIWAGYRKADSEEENTNVDAVLVTGLNPASP